MRISEWSKDVDPEGNLAPHLMNQRFRPNDTIELEDEPQSVHSSTKPLPRKKSGEPTPAWLSRIFRPRVLVPLALVLLLLFFAPRATRLLPDLTKQDAYRLRTRSVRITQPPRWIPANFIDKVIEKAQLPEMISILDADVSSQLSDAFSAHPWVEQVVSVRKLPPATIEIELIYRRPAAMVEVQRGMYPIDAKGILLPPSDFSPSDTQQFPVIQNVQTMPQGPAGTSWGDTSVTASARLAESLAPHWKKFGLTAIRVPLLTKAETSLDELTFELLTTGGSKIIWGRAPGTSFPGELTTDQKIGRLDKYVTDYGRFDQPQGPYEIDIRHWQEISRRPLTARAREIERQ